MKTSLFLNQWFHNKFMAARNWKLVIYLFSTSATIAGGFENSRKLAFLLLWLSSNVPIFLCISPASIALEWDVVNPRKICFFSASSASSYMVSNQDQLHICCTIQALPFTYYVLFLLYFSLSFPSPTSIFFSILNLFIFIWRIIAWQYCVGFCHTSTWISDRYTCSLPLEASFHLPPHPTPL